MTSQVPQAKTSATLSLVSIIGCLATVFALSTGIFDRGSLSGVNTERIQGIFRGIEKLESEIKDMKVSMSMIEGKIHSNSLEVARHNITIISMEKDLLKYERELEELMRRVK